MMISYTKMMQSAKKVYFWLVSNKTSLFLVACFIFLTAFNIRQIWFNKIGYADNGTFIITTSRNGIANVSKPEYFKFNAPQNYLFVEASNTSIKNATDLFLKIYRSIAGQGGIMDIRIIGTVWLTMFLVGIGLILYEMRRIKKVSWRCCAALIITAFGCSPIITAFFSTFYNSGAFWGLFLLFLGITLFNFNSRNKYWVICRLALQLLLLTAIYLLGDVFFTVAIIFLPFVVICCLRDMLSGISNRYLKVVISTVSLGVVVTIFCALPSPEIQSKINVSKYHFYIRSILPSIKNKTAFLKKHGFSEQETSAVLSISNLNYWTDAKPYNTYFLHKLNYLPTASLFFSYPRLFIKSLDYWFLSSHWNAHRRPPLHLGMTPKTSSEQQILRCTSLFSTLLSSKLVVVFFVCSFVLFVICCLLTYCWEIPFSKLLFLHGTLSTIPLFFTITGLAYFVDEEYLLYDIGGFLFILPIISGAILLSHFLKHFADKVQCGRIYKIIQFATSEVQWMLLCIICTLLMELCFSNILYPQKLPVAAGFYFECLLVYVLCLPFRFAAGSNACAILLFVLSILWGFSNKIKMNLTGKPLLPDEFISFEHSLHSLRFVWRSHAFLFAAVLFLSAAIAVVYIVIKNFRKLKKHLLLRLLLFVSSLVICYMVFHIMPLPEKIFTPFWKIESVSDSFKTDGLLNRFIESCRAESIIPDKKHFQALEKEYSNIVQEQKKFHFDNNFKPHVIFILNEAAFDPIKLTKIKFPQKSPFPIAELCKKIKFTTNHFTATGNLQVPVVGGLTVNSEFEMLTGITSMISKKMPYTYINKYRITGIATLLKRRGYETNFLHPYPLSMFTRTDVLPNIGIDNLYDEKYFPPSQDIKNFPYYPDHLFYNKLVEHLEKKSDTPQFMMCVSIQNHGPYNNPRYITMPQFPFEAPMALSSDDKTNLQRYLTGISLSYEALNTFFLQLNNRIKRPTIVIVFGDHLPCLSFNGAVWKNLIADFEKNGHYSINKTEYLVWANYQLPYPLQFRTEMKLYELGRRSSFAAGALPYDHYIYLFDKLKKSDLLMGPMSPFNFIMQIFNGKKIENDIDKYVRMYHALCYKEFYRK